MGSSISDLDGVCEADHNACVAHDARHDELYFVVDVIVLGHPRMDACIGHEEWVCTKSDL